MGILYNKRRSHGGHHKLLKIAFKTLQAIKPAHEHNAYQNCHLCIQKRSNVLKATWQRKTIKSCHYGTKTHLHKSIKTSVTRGRIPNNQGHFSVFLASRGLRNVSGRPPFGETWRDADRKVSVGCETWRNLGGLLGVPTETPKLRRDLWASRLETPKLPRNSEFFSSS